VLVWFVALAGLGLSALAQEAFGNIYGRAVDEQGAGLPGATATLTGDRAPRTTTTDNNGNFRFLRVPNGRYKVTVTLSGFASLERDDVIVTIGKSTEVEARLKLSTVAETVTVSGTTPLLDTRKVTTGSTFAKEELNDIPTSRDIYALMQQVPGIQLDTVNVAGSASGAAGGPNFSVKGSGSVTFLVDGATTTDNTYGTFNGGQARQNGGTNLYFDFESFDQVEITTGGSLLDLQTPGATVNVVTKRGTNELKGSARYFYVSDRFQSSNLPQEAIDQGFQTDSTRYIREYGADVGGPLIKDRLWIWGSGSRQDIGLNLTGNDVEGNRLRSTVKIQPWAAKNQRPGSPATTRSPSTISTAPAWRTASPSSCPPRDCRKRARIWTSRRTSSSSRTATCSRRTSWRRSSRPIRTRATSTYPSGRRTCRRSSTTTATMAAGRPTSREIRSTRPTRRCPSSSNTGKVNHELKASFNYRRQVNDSPRSGRETRSSAPSFRRTRSPRSRAACGPSTRRSITRGTLGDTLTADRLTINAGVRYDVQQGINLTSSAPANPTFPDLLPAVVAPGEAIAPFNYKNWQPRCRRPTRSGRIAIRWRAPPTRATRTSSDSSRGS
jgi:hypothetical protein